jgi:hypothetical protein
MTEDSLSMSISHTSLDHSMRMSHSMPAGEDTSTRINVVTELVSVSPPSPQGTSAPVSESQSEDFLSMSFSISVPTPGTNVSASDFPHQRYP